MQTILKFLQRRQLDLLRLLRLCCIAAALFAAYAVVFYTVPMFQGDYQAAANSGVNDDAVAFYDAALAAYQQENYKIAIEQLNAAYTACATDRGEIPAERLALASQIKFLTGNALVKSRRPKAAVEAYKEALRLDPSHMYAKYNLELLLQMNGGKGPGDDEGGGSGAGNGGKKKI